MQQQQQQQQVPGGMDMSALMPLLAAVGAGQGPNLHQPLQMGLRPDPMQAVQAPMQQQSNLPNLNLDDLSSLASILGLPVSCFELQQPCSALVPMLASACAEHELGLRQRSYMSQPTHSLEQARTAG